MVARITKNSDPVIYPRKIAIDISKAENGQLIPEVSYYPVDQDGMEYPVIRRTIQNFDVSIFADVYGKFSADFEKVIVEIYGESVTIG